MRYDMVAIISVCALPLAACDSEKRQAEFLHECAQHEFTPKQCVLLFAMKSSTDSAAMSAASAQMMGAAGMMK